MRYWIDSASIWLVCLTIGTVPQELNAQEAEGEIALSGEAVDLRYVKSFTTTGTEVGLGLFWNENRDLVANANYYIEASRLPFDRLSVKLGPVAYAARLSTDNMDVFSIAVAAQVRFELLRRQELEFVVEAAYAPDILTFGSADRLWDVSGRAELPLTDRLTGFAGYRLLEIDLLQGTSELEKGIHLGMRYRF